MQMRVIIFLSLLSLTMPIFSMEEEQEEIKQISYLARDRDFNADEQKLILQRAEEIHHMSKEEASQFVSSIQDANFKKTIKEVCCLINMRSVDYYGFSELNKTPTPGVKIPYYITISGAHGNFTISFYHKRCNQSPLYSQPFKGIEIDEQTFICDPSSIKVLVRYEPCFASDLAWEIPSFDEYLERKKVANNNIDLNRKIVAALHAFLSLGNFIHKVLY